MILIINYQPQSFQIRFPLGLAYVAVSLLENDLPVEVFDTIPIKDEQIHAIEMRIQEKEYKYILLSAIAGGHSYGYTKSLVNTIKDKVPNSKVILGGPLPSAIPQMFLQNSQADVCVIGEGEITIIDLIKSLERKEELATVKGIVFRSPEGQIIKTPPRERIRNLDSLPPLPYEIFPFDFYLRYLEKTGRCIEIAGSRGCYGNCDFCSKTFSSPVIRRSIDSITNEMSFLNKKYGIDRFNFTDENFLNDKNQVLQLANKLIGSHLNFQYRFQSRTDFMDRDVAKLLAKSGVFSLHFGIESPVQQLLNNVHKTTRSDQSESAIRFCQDAGIEVYASFIIGLPGETEETLQITRDFIDRNNLEQTCDINLLTPLPNTRLYSLVIERGYIMDEEQYISNLGDLYNELYVNLTDLPDKTLIDFKKSFEGKRKTNFWHEEFAEYLTRK